MVTKPRRGVLLLVVLALLAMFAMVAVAFVILTGSEKISANRVRTIDIVADSPPKTLDQAANVVFGGVPSDPALPPSTSAIKWQSLLEKIYGFERIGTPDASPIGTQGLSAMLTGITQTSLVCDGQLIEFALPATNPDSATFGAAAIDPYHYIGCVVTMLDGPNAGRSTRIVGINPLTLKVQMVAFEGGVMPAANNSFLNGNHYIVNGFPYSGMGFGYDPGTGGLTQLSLKPNSPPSSWSGAKGVITGGVNSDCTVADYQDPLLALAIPYNGGMRVPIPSLHRADLIAFTAGANNSNTLRQVMFRPIGANCGVTNPDHPNFTGSNPNFNPLWDGLPYDANGKAVTYSWDVDNDGDGIADSVWVDLGLPVRYTSDGRAYKPLFAILCLDMDGRLNINANGSYAQSLPAYYQQINPQSYQALNAPPNSGATLDVGLGLPPTNYSNFAGIISSPPTQSPIILPRGQGSGPAEVNLLPLFRDPANHSSFLWPRYQALLSGSGGIMGRYGSPIPAAPMGSALPGANPSGAGMPGSLLTLNPSFPYNGVNGINWNYWSNLNQATYRFDAFGSPPDHQTFGAVGLDRAGRPLYVSLGGPVANGPYDIDLSRHAAHASEQATVDNPFGVAEFERILRIYDRDAGTLPQRLSNLTNSGSGSIFQARRAEFTSESYSVPCAAAVLPPSLRFALPDKRSRHPVDILYAQIAKNNGGDPKKVISQLLPWEVIEGLKMDINRPFGAGPLSTGGTLAQGGVRTIPDQPGTGGERLPQITDPAGAPVSTQFNYVADAGDFSQVNGVKVTDSLAARQLYARHLYVLMMALADTNAILTDLKKINPNAGPEDVARSIAQWSVNVVAYRDHNGIMIPFCYDPTPFSGNGWAPPATKPTATPTDRIKYTVWGCKRPELLITETLAFHDRRTEDRNDEVVDKKKPGADPKRVDPGTTSETDPKKHDPGFNSKFRPQGSLFVEFYNPWTMLEPRTTDLNSIDPVTKQPGVELTKKTGTTPQSPTPSPVWRLVIVDPALPKNALPANSDELPDLDDPTIQNRPTIERAVYFVNLTGMNYPSADGQIVFCLSTTAAAATPLVVPPSGYAVIGSGDNPQQNRTYIGFETNKSAGQPGTTRLVTLRQADLTAADPRVVRNTADPMPTPPNIAIPRVLGVDARIDAGVVSTQRLSISEPMVKGGYRSYEIDGKGTQQTPDPVTGAYPVTLDIPVDQQRDIIGKESVWASFLSHNSTFPGYRIIYLQRLADPTRPYVPETGTDPRQWNPYRTVDAMTVDLTTFNGLSAPKSPIDPTSTTPLYHFEAHQRGEKNYLPGTNPGEVDLWKQEPALKGGPSSAPPTWKWVSAGWVGGGAAPKNPSYFQLPLSQTLGYLNKPYGAPAVSPLGDAQFPFPWLHWSYRPFHNEYELLMVPTVSSSKLLARSTLDPRRYYNYVDSSVRTNVAGQPLPVYDGSAGSQVPYPHLLNFFASGQSSKAGLSAQMHRLFAYVGVPSRFASSQLHVRADVADKSGAGYAPNYFHTPFNRISWYREPGRINLNTITSSDVLLGAMNIYFSPLMVPPDPKTNPDLWNTLNPAFWDKFVRSRSSDGYGSPSPDGSKTLENMLRINPQSPSRFMRPFRTPGGAFLTASGEPAREIDVSLLRGDPDTSSRPLFEIDDYLMGTGTSNLAAGATPDKFATDVKAYPNGLACIDYNRNPYFRYQAIQKLGSVFSNHSNVLAVWITVGYFEVTQVPVDPGHPDGYQLGQELGSDSGDIVRHRAFYIFDRSIPVGFVRGQDINHDKAVLLKRYIE
jgi:hypothetical protein